MDYSSGGVYLHAQVGDEGLAAVLSLPSSSTSWLGIDKKLVPELKAAKEQSSHTDPYPAIYGQAYIDLATSIASEGVAALNTTFAPVHVAWNDFG